MQINAGTQEYRTTGHVNPVDHWDEGADGKRVRNGQARDEATGLPLWSVQAIHSTKSFGQVTDATIDIVVPMAASPRVGQYEFATFEGVVFDIFVRKGSSVPSARITAETVEA